jgi:uncharacterized Zn finger protein
MGRWDDFWFYKPSPPRRVRGGIKAQRQRGAFGDKWWAQRWIAVLESFQIGARLGRGRSYARSGQVLSIDITEGLVKAKVQGSRPKPYGVTIRIKPLSPDSWKRLIAALSCQALFGAKLLAGEMPEDIEQAFKKEGLSLFPQKLKDLETDCSCPDWSNPCKHIAAVYYLLGEEFDRDPFLIFKLRGLSREELLKLLGNSGKKPMRRKKKGQSAVPENEIPRSEPLPTQISKFWQQGSLSDEFLGEVEIPPLTSALLKMLGNFPFWRGRERFMEALEPVYLRASIRGMDVLLGEKDRLKDTERSGSGAELDSGCPAGREKDGQRR